MIGERRNVRWTHQSISRLKWVERVPFGPTIFRRLPRQKRADTSGCTTTTPFKVKRARAPLLLPGSIEYRTPVVRTTVGFTKSGTCLWPNTDTHYDGLSTHLKPDLLMRACMTSTRPNLQTVTALRTLLVILTMKAGISVHCCEMDLNKSFDTLVVDDGSTDATYQEASNIRKCFVFQSTRVGAVQAGLRGATRVRRGHPNRRRRATSTSSNFRVTASLFGHG